MTLTTITLNNPQRFPAGVTITPYLRTNWLPTAPPVDGDTGPRGSAAAAGVAVAADGTCALTGLTAGGRYYGAAQVGGVWTYVRFDVGDRTDLDPGKPVSHQELADAISADGAVIGPASATNLHIVQFDGTSGKLVKDGGALGTAAHSAVGDFDAAGAAAAAAAASIPASAKAAAFGVASLDGTSRVVQNPKLHASTHDEGGSDALTGLPQALIDLYLPWRVDVNPLANIYAASVGVGWAVFTQALQAGGGYLYNATPAVNDAISYDLVLGKGTWTVAILGLKGTSYGIMSVVLDGVTLGTADLYAAAPAYNLHTEFTGAVIAATGKKRLTLSVGSKNASSTNYFLPHTAISLRRTA